MTISEATSYGVTGEPVEHDSAARPEHEPPALPRRSAQQHLEPQLREERGAGHGTSFAAFTPAPEQDGVEPQSGPGSGSGSGSDEADTGEQAAGAAGFREGADRGRRRRRGRHAAEPDDD